MSTHKESLFEEPASTAGKEIDVEANPSATHSDVESGEKENATNVVDWDGPSDPENPLNWVAWKRILQVVLVGVFNLLA